MPREQCAACQLIKIISISVSRVLGLPSETEGLEDDTLKEWEERDMTLPSSPTKEGHSDQADVVVRLCYGTAAIRPFESGT